MPRLEERLLSFQINDVFVDERKLISAGDALAGGVYVPRYTGAGELS